MLTEQQIKEAKELFTAAVSYNIAMQQSFVSTDDMVTATLYVDGKEQIVSIPTYHSLLQTVNKLANMVKNMQVTDDGHDVVQMLSQANNLKLLYLKRQQYYVQKPSNLSILKFDYETVPTSYSSSNRTSMFIDLSKSDLPMDANFAMAQLDDEQPMLLPILYKQSCFDKLCNVLSVNGEDLLVDSNSLTVGEQVQVRSTIFEVTAVAGNIIKLQSTELAAPTVQEGDVIYSITKAYTAIVEVPVSKLHKKLKLQVAYMRLLSAAAELDIESAMANGIHSALQMALADCLSGKNLADSLAIVNTGTVALPNNLEQIIADSKPTIDDVQIKQANTHQYINSAIESLMKANAALELAKKDINRYEQLLAAGDLDTDTILQYKEQLASAQTRYEAAQHDLAELQVSAQNVSPEYTATIYSASTDSAGGLIIRHIVRYQRLSYGINDLSNDWLYIYGDARNVDKDGNITSDIDNYSVLKYVRVPIHAYEQLAVQVRAELCYGQPLVHVYTDWSDTKFIQIPNDLLKEQSVDAWQKNAYEARLYTQVQQALTAAGVSRHIDITRAYAHRAADINWDDQTTLLDKIVSIVNQVTSLQDVANAAQSIEVQVLCGGKTYSVTNGGTVEINVERGYFNEVFGSLATDVEKEAALGTIAETDIVLRIINRGSQAVLFTTMIAGSPTVALTDRYANYAGIGINAGDAKSAQRFAQAAYAAKSNISGSRYLVYDETEISPDDDYKQLAYYTDADTEHMHSAYDHSQLFSGNNDQQLGFASLLATSRQTQKYAGKHEGAALHIGYTLDSGVTLTATHFTAGNEPAVADILPSLAGWPIAMFKEPYMQMAYYNVLTRVGSTDVEHKSKAWFEPRDKFTSGDATRGAALFFAPNAIVDMALPVNGTGNGKMIEPGDANAIDLPIKFQCRMTDRLGLVDGQDGETVTIENGHLSPCQTTGLTYKKAMAIHMNIGNADFKFDLIVSRPYTTL